MRMFLRKAGVERDPLAVTMSGVRLGERVLQIGDGDARTIAMIAGKTGLTGSAAIVVAEDQAAARIRRAVSDAGALVDVRVTKAVPLPFDDAAFDAIVIHDPVHTTQGGEGSSAGSAWMLECRRVLRVGGRIVAIEPGTPVGLRALFQGESKRADGANATVDALRSAGFATVRVLGDREGLRFIEALNVA